MNRVTRNRTKMPRLASWLLDHNDADDTAVMPANRPTSAVEWAGSNASGSIKSRERSDLQTSAAQSAGSAASGSVQLRERNNHQTSAVKHTSVVSAVSTSVQWRERDNRQMSVVQHTSVVSTAQSSGTKSARRDNAKNAMTAIMNTHEFKVFYIDRQWTPASSTMGRITRQIEARAKYILDNVRDPTVFKFGITAECNMQYRAYSYFMEGMREFRALYKSSEAGIIEMIEVYLIRAFEQLRKSATHNKDVRCLNVQPGGEGKMRNYDPQYVAYMVVGIAGSIDDLSRHRRRFILQVVP